MRKLASWILAALLLSLCVGIAFADGNVDQDHSSAEISLLTRTTKTPFPTISNRHEDPTMMDGEKRILQEGTSEMSPNARLLLDQETYTAGEDIIVSIPATIPGVSRLDYLALFAADIQDFTSTDPLKQVSLLTSTNEARSRINFDNTGRFKFALLTANATTVLGESADFDIVPRTPEQLVLDKTSYVTGESINITIPRASDAQIGDDIKFYLEGETPSAELPGLRQVDLMNVTTDVVTVRLDFVQSGRLKILLCVDGTQIVLGQSMEFEVSVAMDSELVLDKAVYEPGETATISFPVGAPFIETTDELRVYPVNETDFTTIPFSFRPIILIENDETPYRINFDQVGTYKIVLVIRGRMVTLGESSSFEVVPLSTVHDLMLGNDTFSQGDLITITAPNVTTIARTDDTRLYPANQTDFSVPPLWEDTVLGTDLEESYRVVVDPGMYKFVLLLSRTTILLAESPAFDIVPSSPVQLMLSGSAFVQGDTITITAPDTSSVQSFDDFRLYPANQTDFSVPPLWQNTFIGSARQSSYRVDVDDVGMYKFVLLIDGSTIAAGQSLPFEVTSVSPQRLTLNGDAFTQGDSITITIPNTPSIESFDDLRLFPANQTNFTSPPALWTDSFIGSSGSVFYTVNIQEVGMYRFVLFVSSTTTVLGESPVFNINAILPQRLVLSGDTFSPRDVITITAPDPSRIRASDDLRLYPANQTDFISVPALWIDTFIGSDGIETYRVANLESGLYRFVLFVDGSFIVAGESPVFEVVPATPAQLTLNGNTFALGDFIRITIPTTPSIQSSDDLRLFPANQTDFTSPPALWTDSFIGSSGLQVYRVNVQAGMYKFVLFASSTTDVLGQSPAFAITPLPTSLQLSLNGNSFSPGQTITITVPSFPSFEADDDLRLFPATETNFSAPALWFDSFIGSDREETYRVGVGAGMYKFVLFVDGSRTVLAESPAFEVTPSTAAQIMLDGTSFAQGDTIVITIPRSPSIESADDLRLYPANQTNFSAPALYLDSFIGSSGRLTYRVDVQEVGMYKFVLFVSATNGAIGESPAFEVTAAVSREIGLDRLVYTQGDTIMMDASGVPSVRSFDDLGLYNASITNGTASNGTVFENLVRRITLPSGFGTRTLMASVLTGLDDSEVGMFRLLILLDGTQAVLGQSPVFEVVPRMPVNLTLPQLQYTQADTITLERPESLMGTALTIVVQQADTSASVFRGSFTGTEMLSVPLLPAGIALGTYELVLFVRGTSNVLWVSPPFEVVLPARQTLTIDKLSYSLGETISVTSSFPVDGSRQTLRLVTSTNGTLTTGDGRLVLQSSLPANERSTTIRINFNETGRFRILLVPRFSSIVVAESPEFEVVSSTQLLPIPSLNFNLGETVSVRIPDAVGLNPQDSLHLYRADEFNFSPLRTRSLLQEPLAVRRSSFLDRVTIRPEVPIRLTMPGMFKFVILVEDDTGILLARSLDFTVSSNNVTASPEQQIELDKTLYAQGETARVQIPTAIAGFNPQDDELRVVAAGGDPSVLCALSTVRQQVLTNLGRTAMSRINFDATGMFQYVLCTAGTNIALAQSPAFQVIAPIMPGIAVIVEKPSFALGERSLVLLKTLRNVNLSTDELRLVSAGVTDLSTARPEATWNVGRFRSSTGTNGISLRFPSSVRGTGPFKLVLSIRGTSIMLGMSAEFDLVSGA